jgi:hypothetical protein
MLVDVPDFRCSCSTCNEGSSAYSVHTATANKLVTEGLLQSVLGADTHQAPVNKDAKPVT